MSFLSAAFLIALPLVAVPVAIHLYRGRQRDVILWGAMQFLASAVTKGRRMERLEELLLMALRFAAVAALVLALARPMVRSSWLGHSTEREVVLVLDNSLSMSREVDDETAAERLREQALETIDSLSNADAVQVLLASGGEWATAEGIAADSDGRRRLREIVEEVEPTLGTADLLASLQSAIHLHAAEQLTGRRVIVFSDDQASNWHAEAEAAWRQLAAERDAAEFPITLEVVNCGLESPEIENLAVSNLRAERNLVRPGEQVKVTAEVANTGDVVSEAARVEWLVGGKVVEDSPVKTLHPRGKAEVTATLRMEQGGIFAVTCRLENADQLPLDQEDNLIIEVADELPILIVQSDASASADVTAPQLLAATLGYKDGQPQSWHSVFRPDTITLDELATHSLFEYRAILINNPGQLDRETIERLAMYVRAGGGLWIALGDQVDRVDFNRDWYSDGDGLSPLELETLSVIEKTDDVAATVHPPSRDHPATLALANTTQLDIDEGRIRERWVFSGQQSDDDIVSALLESGDGSPLVVEKYVGQGRVLVQVFPLGLEWSNLPSLKSYVVMVLDWLDYLTAPTMARYNLAPGAPIVASPPVDVAEASAELVTPRGRAIPLVATDADVAPVFRYTQTTLPGMYRVRFRDGDDTVSEVPFRVARDPRESDLRPLSDDDRAKLLAAGVNFGPETVTVAEAKDTQPRREPFWGLLLAALVALLAGELLLSGGLARQRSGFAVHTA